MKADFHSIYAHDFIRTAVCVPPVRVAEPQGNVDAMLTMVAQAHQEQAALVLFPELGISAYSNDDLFHQDALLESCRQALQRLRVKTRSFRPVVIAGCPLRHEGALYNCAVVLHAGRILGIVPKTYLPNYREFYEKRQFTSGAAIRKSRMRLLGEDVPFGTDLIFSADGCSDFNLYVEVCEDLWSPIPPSSFAALAGATVIANLSASNITIGKAAYRKMLCASQSAKCLSAYLYSAAGYGESTTDLAWDGYALIYENQQLLAEAERFASHEQIVYADIDLGRLQQDRMRQTSFQDAAGIHSERVQAFQRIPFSFQPPSKVVALRRFYSRFPYVPGDLTKRDQRCYEVYNIQVTSLARRMEAAGIDKLVVGVSGGLDSTQALLVAARTMDRLGLPRTNVLAYTMPGFATSERTLENAHKLMTALQVSSEEIDIRPSCMQMFKDLGHPYARGEQVYDTTFENVQAGERTSHLFRLANLHGAMVVGTGDLSELALGWTTYGVGDQMAHYNVNASVPKTLIQYLIRWVMEEDVFGDGVRKTLQSILATEISPELIPIDDKVRGNHDPAQRTEDIIGPYELHDFFLYYISRFGFRPSKVAYLCEQVWGLQSAAPWPVWIPVEERHSYTLDEIKRWLRVFLRRFFEFSQFKRSAMPNGPKVGSGGSLSPRGDWRAPSDASAAVWLQELEDGVP